MEYTFIEGRLRAPFATGRVFECLMTFHGWLSFLTEVSSNPEILIFYSIFIISTWLSSDRVYIILHISLISYNFYRIVN